MGVTSIGVRNAGSFGTTKSDAAVITDESRQLPAVQWNNLADALIDAQTAIGTTASPAGGSLEGRAVNHEGRITANEASIASLLTRLGTIESGFKGIRTVTGSDTPTLADAGGLIDVNAAAPNDQTIPTHAAVAYPVGTLLSWFFRGAGLGTVVAAGVTTIVPPGLSLVTQGQGSWVYGLKLATNTWAITGHLEPA
jgi:hypothetical protein